MTSLPDPEGKGISDWRKWFSGRFGIEAEFEVQESGAESREATRLTGAAEVGGHSYQCRVTNVPNIVVLSAFISKYFDYFEF